MRMIRIHSLGLSNPTGSPPPAGFSLLDQYTGWSAVGLWCLYTCSLHLRMTSQQKSRSCVVQTRTAKKEFLGCNSKRHPDGFRDNVSEKSCAKNCLERLWNFNCPLEKQQHENGFPFTKNRTACNVRYEIPVFQSQPPIQLPPPCLPLLFTLSVERWPLERHCFLTFLRVTLLPRFLPWLSWRLSNWQALPPALLFPF